MKKAIIFLFLVVSFISCEEEPPVLYQLVVTATAGGTTNISGGSFEEGTAIDIVAIPEAEYEFVQWSNGEIKNPLSIVLSANQSIEAQFARKKYELTILKEGEGDVKEKLISSGKDYDSGTKVELTAIPSTEWLFVGWTGDIESKDNPIQVVINHPKKVNALFAKRKYPLTINIEGQGAVDEEIVYSNRTSDYDSGTMVKLTAAPSEGWNFLSWTGTFTSNSSSIQVDVNGPIELTATFTEAPFSLKFTRTKISAQGLPSLNYISGAFYNVSGPLHYESDGEHYMLFPGNSSWSAAIPPAPSHVLKRIDGYWEHHKRYDEATFIGPRNFDIEGNFIAIGDGNELGSNSTDWKGDTWLAEIMSQGELKWSKVNSPSEKGYYHGTSIGDLNKDGLMDIGGTPGVWDDEIKQWRLMNFIQTDQGDFIYDENLYPLGQKVPFTLDYSDVMGDERDEIITADYGGGNPFIDKELNNIKVFTYDESERKYKLHFESNEPTAFYNFGLGATSIKVFDFDNDGIKDISVAREDMAGSAFEVWKGIGQGRFKAHWASPVWTGEEMQFREFWVLDVNNDGFKDIVLRPFHHGTLYRNSPRYWNGYDVGNGIILNHLIWINNGDGTFNHYNTEDLIVEGIFVDNVHPYMDQGKLHFMGTFTEGSGLLYGENAVLLNTYDIIVNIK